MRQALTTPTVAASQSEMASSQSTMARVPMASGASRAPPQRSSAMNCSRVMELGEIGERGEQPVARLLQGVDRASGGGRGLLSSWASPAASVPRATSASRCRDMRLHHPHGLEEALDEVQAEREPGRRPARETVGGHPEDPASGGAAAGGEIAPVSSQARKPPAHSPGRSIAPTTGLLAADLADEVDAPVDEHPPGLGGLPLLEQLRPRVEGHLGADGEQQACSWSSSLAVEENRAAEIVEFHHVVAR